MLSLRKYVECRLVRYSLHQSDAHFGVDWTLGFARMVDSSISRSEVEKCVRSCIKCQSVDPVPATHEEGSIAVGASWSRLAMDTTHYGGKCYMTLIDCGPSRFAIWREVCSENAAEIVKILDELFRERGPVDELLSDNGLGFRSFPVAELCRQWNVIQLFRCAYRPEGNGIIERHHRTIKRMAQRCGSCPLRMVFWYNLAPKKGVHDSTAPSRELYSYKWRHPFVKFSRETPKLDGLRYSVGDDVLVKPPGAKCTSTWKRGRVTKINSSNNIEVNGIPRHPLDIRRVFRESLDETSEETSDDDEEPEEQYASEPEARRTSSRSRRPPRWLDDYVT